MPPHFSLSLCNPLEEIRLPYPISKLIYTSLILQWFRVKLGLSCVIGPFGRQWQAVTLWLHCPQMTQRRCRYGKFWQTFLLQRYGSILTLKRARLLFLPLVTVTILQVIIGFFGNSPHSQRGSPGHRDRIGAQVVVLLGSVLWSFRSWEFQILGQTLCTHGMSRGQPGRISFSSSSKSLNFRWDQWLSICY